MIFDRSSIEKRMGQKQVVFLVLILILAGSLRLIYLDKHDVRDDEAIIGPRSVGLYDYLQISTLLTPVQILEEEQWWQKLSFHDHPPLVFWIQNISIKLFGENAWGLRLPSALAGVGAVFLVFLIGRRLLGVNFGLLAALGLSVANYHLWASRVGFLESIEVFFVLLALFYFLKTFDNPRYWLAVGVVSGLAVLSKYFAVILLPIFVVLVLIYQRRAFHSAWLYLGILLAFIFLLPVIIYNINLYNAVGYFDTPVSSLFRSVPSVYSESLGDRIFGKFNPAGLALYVHGTHFVEILLLLGGISFLFRDFYRTKKNRFPLVFILASIIVIIILFSLIPLKKQYLVLLTPFSAWAAAYLLLKLFGFLKKYQASVIVAVVFIFLGLVGVNSQILKDPVGKQYYSYLPLRPFFLGYQSLDNWVSEFHSDHNYRHSFYGGEPQIKAFQDKIFDSWAVNPLADVSERELLVYDSGMDFSAVRWIFIRRKLYDIRPIVMSELFLTDLLERPGFQQETRNQFDTIYFVFLDYSEGGQNEEGEITDFSRFFLDILTRAGQEPIDSIQDADGQDQFQVYSIDIANFDEEFTSYVQETKVRIVN